MAAALPVHPFSQGFYELVPACLYGVFHNKNILPLPALLFFQFLQFILKLFFFFDGLRLARLALRVPNLEFGIQ